MRALSATCFFAALTMTVPAHAHVGSGYLDYPYSLEDIRAGAQLRAEAAIVVPIVFGPCGHSPAMDPVLDRYAEFVESLTEIRQKIDLDIALADYNYQMSLVDIACPEPEAPETLEREKLQISVADSVLDRMDALVERQTGQEQ
ncbi:hypothetical protein [Erythrobacter crassostreae]|uniref:Uncharacterized protein n=1 Tax=Erythrobacter crassostreae TaxID=2828328 RepID=A0A9X1F454_9SPHN|nr:hypothetical protein [Erythrobacter crassostrea]MBV7259459.1 hypothetical protein [Erythrobacter crassostrea]